MPFYVLYKISLIHRVHRMWISTGTSPGWPTGDTNITKWRSVYNVPSNYSRTWGILSVCTLKGCRERFVDTAGRYIMYLRRRVFPTSKKYHADHPQRLLPTPLCGYLLLRFGNKGALARRDYMGTITTYTSISKRCRKGVFFNWFSDGSHFDGYLGKSGELMGFSVFGLIGWGYILQGR